MDDGFVILLYKDFVEEVLSSRGRARLSHAFYEACTPADAYWRLGLVYKYLCGKEGWGCREAARNLTPEYERRHWTARIRDRFVHEGLMDRYPDIRPYLRYAFPEMMHEWDPLSLALKEYARTGKVNFRMVRHVPRAAEEFIMYAIETTLGGLSVRELYGFFSDRARAVEWLRRNGLYAFLKLYCNDTLALLHYSLPFGWDEEMFVRMGGERRTERDARGAERPVGCGAAEPQEEQRNIKRRTPCGMG